MTGFISKEKQLQLKNTAEALKQNYMDDITIAQRFACEPIEQIADKLGKIGRASCRERV